MDISSLSAQDITTYLKNVMETESSLFKQKMVRQEAQNCLHYEEPVKQEIKEPQLECVAKPVTPKPPIDKSAYIIGNIIYSVMAIVFALSGLFGIWVGGLGGIVLGLSGLSFAGLFVWGISKLKSTKNESEMDAYRYQREMHQYENKVAKSKEDYEQAMSAYAESVEAEEQRYTIALSAARKHYQAAKEQVQQLDKPLEETEMVLQKLYDMDIIFPKYRNLPAVCMFFEYFASGRCSELSGPNGAYNLYEAELRQNLIINKLDAIMGSLEGIKQNQYILYSEVKKTADALPMISRDITGMLDTSQQLSQSAAITAQCAEAAKTNTDMLKYLAFIRR